MVAGPDGVGLISIIPYSGVDGYADILKDGWTGDLSSR